MRSGIEAVAARSPVKLALAARSGTIHRESAWRLLTYALASAALLGCAVPPRGVAVAAWVALVPLLVAIRNESPVRVALIGTAFGVASLAAMHTWFLTLPGANPINVAALFGYLAVYPATWCAALAFLMRRKLPWVFPGAVLWALLDWLRSHAGPFAVPWDPLAHSQIHDVPLLQLAALGGAPLISFFVCLVNLAVARAMLNRSLPSLLAAALGMAAVHVYGYLSVAAAPLASGTRIAVVQPADDGAPPATRLDRLRALTQRAASQAPDLIVWPESAVDGYAFNHALQGAVARIAHDVKTPILFGSADFGKFAKSAGAAGEHVQFKNRAYLVFPDGSQEGPYTKNRLVPFGEFMPFENYVEWPHWLVGRQRGGIAGVEPGVFRLHNGTTLGVVVCWENMFAYLTDRLVRRGAAIIVQLSDDSDFGASGEPAQHNSASALRAVEFGRPWVQASANGPSEVIDDHGRINYSFGQIGSSGWTVRTLSLGHTTTVYERFGMLWLALASLVATVQIVLRLKQERRGEDERQRTA